MSEAGTIITQYVNYYDVLLDICYPTLVEQELRLKKMVRKNWVCPRLLIFAAFSVIFYLDWNFLNESTMLFSILKKKKFAD